MHEMHIKRKYFRELKRIKNFFFETSRAHYLKRLADCFIRIDVDETEICCKRLFTVLVQVCLITDEIKPFQSGNVFTSTLIRLARF